MHERILEGIYPNKKVYFYNKSIEITSPQVRKCIFDTLKHHKGTEYSMLDCNAGSGIMGIEALCRGSKIVTFFDSEAIKCKDIEKNLNTLSNITGVYNILCCNLLHPPKGRPVDVIYIKPNSRQVFLLGKFIIRLHENNWINDNTIIVTLTSTYDTRTVECFKENTFSNKVVSFFKFNNNILNKHLFRQPKVIKSNRYQHDKRILQEYKKYHNLL